MAAIGTIAIAAKQPWLFPSLGPTIFLQTVTPRASAARTWNIAAGHAVGALAGFAALFLCGAQGAPSALGGEPLSMARVAATAIAVTVTVGAQVILRALHPPAAATTMLITLGGVNPGWRGLGSITAGVLLVAIFGALIRLFRVNEQRHD